MKKILVLSVAIFYLAACGVKGKPLPPLKEPPIGTGNLRSQKKQDQKKSSGPRTAPLEEDRLPQGGKE